MEGSLGFANGTPTQTLDQNTEFIFWLDNSGSLGSFALSSYGGPSGEIEQLINMTNNELKDSFLSYYNNDIAKYQSQVIYNANPRTLGVSSDSSSERVFQWASVEKQNSNSTKLVHLIYFDESESSYHNKTNGDNTKTSTYTTDIASLRTSLDNQTNYGDKMVVLFLSLIHI